MDDGALRITEAYFAYICVIWVSKFNFPDLAKAGAFINGGEKDEEKLVFLVKSINLHNAHYASSSTGEQEEEGKQRATS